MEDNQQEVKSAEAKSKSFNPAMIIVVVLVIGIAAFVFLKPKNSMETEMKPTPTDVQAQTSQQPSQAMNDTNVKEFTLEGGSFYYKPNVINVKKGDKVKVTLNSVSMMHDFVIDELNVKSERAASGKSTTVEFVADKVGSFQFYCSVGQHRANGMVGTINVTE